MSEGAAVPDLYAALVASRPAETTAEFGPWRLHRGVGAAWRELAAMLEGPLDDPAPAIAAMRDEGERAAFLVREGEAELEEMLAERGFIAEGWTLLYAGSSASLAFHAPDLAVIDCDGPIAIMGELWAEAGADPERLAAMERVAAPKRFLLGRHGDRTAGAAFVSAHGCVAMLNAVIVAPRARRRGLGRRFAQYAASWAVNQGAGTLGLAVEADNAPARALWEGLGMQQVGSYHYRAAPKGEIS